MPQETHMPHRYVVVPILSAIVLIGLGIYVLVAWTAWIAVVLIVMGVLDPITKYLNYRTKWERGELPYQQRYIGRSI